MPTTAITRRVPASFTRALAAQTPSTPIDVELARAQHAAYCAALAAHGLSVVTLDADDTLPDCCFVEDAAVVADGVALITRPGAPSRRGETSAVARALADLIRFVAMTPPATLDGGDCLRLDSTIYVGRSKRTNEQGIAQLRKAFEPHGLRIVPVELPAHVLHLKSVCAPLGDGRITLLDTMPRAPFGDVAAVSVPTAESYAANVLTIGKHVLVAEGFPRTAEAIAAAGLEPVPLATTEFRKADGALTCLSVLV